MLSLNYHPIIKLIHILNQNIIIQIIYVYNMNMNLNINNHIYIHILYQY